MPSATMTSHERETLVRLLDQLATAQSGQKDAEFHSLVQDACAKQPDALYVLVQRSIELDGALRAAQDQLHEMQVELERVRTRAV